MIFGLLLGMTSRVYKSLLTEKLGIPFFWVGVPGWGEGYGNVKHIVLVVCRVPVFISSLLTSENRKCRFLSENTKFFGKSWRHRKMAISVRLAPHSISILSSEVNSVWLRKISCG